MQANVHRLSMTHPGDVSALETLIQAQTLEPGNVRAIIGKTEGNGGVNDFTRGYFTQSLFHLLAQYTNESSDALKHKIPCVLSGGTEGVLSPHYLVFSVDDDASDSARHEPSKALAIGTAFSENTPPEHIGRRQHIDQVANGVKAAMQQARIDHPSDVHFVQVKSPCITTQSAQAAQAAGKSLVTSDPNRSMAFARVAAAWGVGIALGDIDPDAIDAENILSDFTHHSNCASTSSGIEVTCNEIIVLGKSSAWSGPLHIAHAPMSSAIDIEGIYQTLNDLNLSTQAQLSPSQQAAIRGVLVKCEPDRRGHIFGNRHTMLDDTDINAQRHIRGAVGGLVAGVLGDTRIFVSGGAENQGPDGGGLISIIAEKQTL